MSCRPSRVERVTRGLNVDPLLTMAQPKVDFWSQHGVKQHSHWTPPAPHARQEVSIGANVQTDRIVQSDNRTTAEVIADMMARVR